jgi:hypothetical protein
MRTIGWSLLSVFLMVASTGGGASAATAPKARAAGARGAAPLASSDEVTKLKGDFKWGMSPDDVLAKMVEKVEGSYDERLKKTVNDPTKQDRVRKEMMSEVEQVKKNSLVKFDEQKTGYDVSIIDQEFTHGVGESMLVGKDANASRYFFFVNDRLYKMYIAFDKDMLAGKDFRQFGQMMQARFGKAREVFVDEKSKAGVTHKLDHFEWNTRGGDVLRLVDRSGFYDVYCLVIADAAVAARQAEAHRARARADRPDSLVEAVTNGKPDPHDSNDNVVDRITGRQVHKPGDEPETDIKVPMPAVKAPTPAEVNGVEPPSQSAPKAAARPAKGKGKDGKPNVEL